MNLSGISIGLSQEAHMLLKKIPDKLQDITDLSSISMGYNFLSYNGSSVMTTNPVPPPYVVCYIEGLLYFI